MTTLENLKEKYNLEADEYSQALKQIQSKEPNEETVSLLCSHFKNLEEFENNRDFEKVFSGVLSNELKLSGVDYVVALEVALGDKSMKLIKNNLAPKKADKHVNKPRRCR